MKKQITSFLSGILATLLLVGLIGTAAATVGKRTLEADYSDIKITLDGNMVIPLDANKNYVEPFAIGGTVYLPIRATANAVNLDVDWDGKNSTVLLKTKPVKTAMDPFYENTTIPKFDFVIGLKALTFSAPLEDDNSVFCYAYDLSISENGDFLTLKSLYADMLKKVSYLQTSSGDLNGNKYFIYKNAGTGIELTLHETTPPSGSKGISIYIDFSAAKSKPTSGGTATSSSGIPSVPDNEPAPPPSPSPDPTPVFDFTVPHLTAQGTRPSLCTYCQTELRRVTSFDDGRAIYKCRDPQCGKYEIPIYYTP